MPTRRACTGGGKPSCSWTSLSRPRATLRKCWKLIPRIRQHDCRSPCARKRLRSTTSGTEGYTPTCSRSSPSRTQRYGQNHLAFGYVTNWPWPFEFCFKEVKHRQQRQVDHPRGPRMGRMTSDAIRGWFGSRSRIGSSAHQTYRVVRHCTSMEERRKISSPETYCSLLVFKNQTHQVFFSDTSLLRLPRFPGNGPRMGKPHHHALYFISLPSSKVVFWSWVHPPLPSPLMALPVASQSCSPKKSESSPLLTVGSPALTYPTRAAQWSPRDALLSETRPTVGRQELFKCFSSLLL